MEARGIPTTTLVTKMFESLGNVTAKGKGMPTLPITVLPYPFDQLPEQEIREITRKTIPDLIRALAPAEGTPHKS